MAEDDYVAFHFPKEFAVRATLEAAKRGLTIEGFLISAVDHMCADQRREKCLCPTCIFPAVSLGLCRTHYQKAIYYRDKGLLSEDWMVRHGRMKAKSGFVPAAEDTLDTIPKMPKRRIFEADLVWLFDYPDSQKERKRLEDEGLRKILGVVEGKQP